jgi:hypothetical protein
VVADHSLTPDKLRGLARKLNHFGAVAISEESVEFDGDDVKWSDITEIRRRSLIECLFTGGIDKQADKLPLPWFPGRGMLLAAVILTDPAVRQCFEGTAHPHGVEIRPADDDVMEDADERAEQIKSMLASVQVRLDRGWKHAEIA